MRSLEGSVMVHSLPKACNTLQSYYRNALMNNLGSVDSMRAAVWSTLMHCMSTDENTHHLRCPQGEDSWCFFNRAVARGETPAQRKCRLNYDDARAIRPVYERMSDPALLKRVQQGKTQNANEALNGTIWIRCPKTGFIGMNRLMTGVASAVSHFNQGTSHLSQVMTHLDIVHPIILQAYQEQSVSKLVFYAQSTGAVISGRFTRSRKTEKDVISLNKMLFQRRNTTESIKSTARKCRGGTYGPGLLGVADSGL